MDKMRGTGRKHHIMQRGAQWAEGAGRATKHQQESEQGEKMVGVVGLEPTTSRSRSVRASQLRHTPTEGERHRHDGPGGGQG